MQSDDHKKNTRLAKTQPKLGFAAETKDEVLSQEATGAYNLAIVSPSCISPFADHKS
jgi:hypothetical protein